MSSFKSFINQELFVEFVQQSFEAGVQQKKPKATRQELLDIWQKIQPDVPIYIVPMDDTFNSPGDHSTYGEDGVRITGSWPFIASILGRLKDMLQFENPQTKLRLVFRGVKADSKATAQRQAYAFYINLERKKVKKPRMTKPKI